MWALISNEDQLLARHHEPTKHTVIKIALRQDKPSKRLLRSQRIGGRIYPAVKRRYADMGDMGAHIRTMTPAKTTPFVEKELRTW
jgi:hypothetical protein